MLSKYSPFIHAFNLGGNERKTAVVHIHVKNGQTWDQCCTAWGWGTYILTPLQHISVFKPWSRPGDTMHIHGSWGSYHSFMHSYLHAHVRLNLLKTELNRWMPIKGGNIVRTPGLSFPDGFHIQLVEKHKWRQYLRIHSLFGKPYKKIITLLIWWPESLEASNLPAAINLKLQSLPLYFPTYYLKWKASWRLVVAKQQLKPFCPHGLVCPSFEGLFPPLPLQDFKLESG